MVVVSGVFLALFFQMRQDLSQTRLKLERAGKTEHELRESIRELEPLRKEVFQSDCVSASSKTAIELGGDITNFMKNTKLTCGATANQVAQLAVAVQAFPQERQHLLDELKQFQDEHQSQLAQSINVCLFTARRNMKLWLHELCLTGIRCS